MVYMNERIYARRKIQKMFIVWASGVMGDEWVLLNCFEGQFHQT